ncbi:YcgN family cysteine cluster protein [Oceanibium sediminis]|uniref:YcgN family cysteine cluster protein n=1 Tax=Oceanibium sediminis TaxID=2026339 RepID=UPI000DD42BE7|nr:YcgN family cysteine cluster protein [Oceanibium sediminis]
MTDDPIKRSGLRPRFWETVPMADMTRDEWEALCDGCGKCCLRKLEFEDTGEVEYTNVACKLLDTDTCRCRDYANRKAKVPDCVVISPKTLPSVLYWMPGTCAYRLLAEDQPLPDWHPLISGRAESVAEAGISLAGHMISEEEIDEDDLEEYIVEGLQ